MMEDYLDKFVKDSKSSKNLLPLAARIKDVTPHSWLSFTCHDRVALEQIESQAF
jgi:hypothetical protein